MASSADLNYGLLLLFAYSLGLALAFLLAALLIDRVRTLFQPCKMITGCMTVLSSWLQQWTRLRCGIEFRLASESTRGVQSERAQ